MAGRERGGPENARSDLFRGRPWVLTPTALTPMPVLRAAYALAEACGATPVVMEAARHDDAVAAVSHVPQLLSSALAVACGRLDDEDVRIAGPGLADMTRLAASPADLWADIAAANAPAIGQALAEVLRSLDGLSTAMRQGGPQAAAAVRELVSAGNVAAARLPRKRGHTAGEYTHVAVTVRDEPGALLAVLQVLADRRINVDDVRVEHVPGEPTGIVDVSVSPALAEAALAVLDDAGLTAYLAEGS